jgi:hypothetical protein
MIMNNVYFGNEGMTSTTANHYANIAKEMIKCTEKKLYGVKFYQTSISAIGSTAKQLMSQGSSDISFIDDALREIAEANSFCAWVREAIKEKEAQQLAVSRKDLNEWMKEQGIEIKEEPEYPDGERDVTEEDIINTWDINKRNKYLRLEAYASTIGNYIHPGKNVKNYNDARRAMHNAINNPITKEGSGRDTILFYVETTVDPDMVDAQFLKMQDMHRSYEKELNAMKAELRETVNNINQQKCDALQLKIDAYYAEHREYIAWKNEMRNKLNKWKVSETERLSKLKIVIPKDLKDIFQKVKAVDSK